MHEGLLFQMFDTGSKFYFVGENIIMQYRQSLPNSHEMFSIFFVEEPRTMLSFLRDIILRIWIWCRL